MAAHWPLDYQEVTGGVGEAPGSSADFILLLLENPPSSRNTGSGLTFNDPIKI